MTENQNKAYQKIENLVTKRFNKKSLEKKLSQILGEDVRLIKVDEKELVGDYEFTSEKDWKRRFCYHLCNRSFL